MPASFRHLSDSLPLNENILAKWHEDGLYYKVKILKSNEKERSCLVEYEDKTLTWVKATDLHIQLSLDELKDESIYCCICDDGFSKAPNEIIMCDFCQQGYHIECHEPKVDREKSKLDDEEVEWICSTCKDLTRQQLRQIEQEEGYRASTPVTPKSKQSQTKQKSTSKKIKKVKLNKLLTHEEKVALTETRSFVNSLKNADEIVDTIEPEKRKIGDEDKSKETRKSSSKRKHADMVDEEAKVDIGELKDKEQENGDEKSEKDAVKKKEKKKHSEKKKESQTLSDNKTASAF